MTPLVPALVTRFARASNPHSRVNAIMALGEIGPEAKPAVPAMLEASGTADLEIAGRAVEALVKVDPQLAATRLSSLLDWMRSGQVTSVRLSAMASLRDLGPAAATALPALLKVADEEGNDLPSGEIGHAAGGTRFGRSKCAAVSANCLVPTFISTTAPSPRTIAMS